MKIETQIVGNGSYGIQRDFDPIGVFHLIDEDKVIGTYATLREAKSARRQALKEKVGRDGRVAS